MRVREVLWSGCNGNFDGKCVQGTLAIYSGAVVVDLVMYSTSFR